MNPLLVSESTAYFINSGLMAVGAIVVVLYGLVQSRRERTMILVGAIPIVSMAIAYTGMGMEILTVETEGREQSIVRFFAYTAALVAMAYIIKRAVGLSNRWFAGLSVVLLLVPWSALISWVVPGLLNTLFTLASILTFVFAAYVLMGPVSRFARERSGEQRLFYNKLRNLFVLCYGCLIVTSAVSEQAMGLVDTLVGQVMSGYIDMILMYGVALLVISSVSVLVADSDEDAEAPERTDTTDQTEGTATATQ